MFGEIKTDFVAHVDTRMAGVTETIIAVKQNYHHQKIRR